VKAQEITGNVALFYPDIVWVVNAIPDSLTTGTAPVPIVQEAG